jgi:ubiquinone biosynthesis protein UbiJ
VHRGLADCSRRAHELAAAGDDVAAVEAEIDALAARLWGVTDAELGAVHESLAALE